MKAPRRTNFFCPRPSEVRFPTEGTNNLLPDCVTVVVTLALGLAVIGCGKPGNGRSNEPPATGAMMGQVYTNRFFGFSLAVPAGWSVDSSPAGQSLKTTSSETFQLLRISEKPINSPGDSNPTLLVVAEKCSASGTQTGKEYLEQLTRLLDGARIKQADREVPYSKRGGIREKRLGGRLFHRADLTARVGTRPVHQSYFSTVANDHVLSLIIAGLSDAEMKRLEAIVATVVFAPR